MDTPRPSPRRTILFALLAADPDAEQPLDLSGLGLPSYTPDLRHPHLVSRLDLSGNRLQDLPAALSVCAPPLSY